MIVIYCRNFLVAIFVIVCIGATSAQDRYDSTQAELQYLANEYPGLLERVELNVSDVNLSEFLNTIAISNRLNISVDESLNFLVTNNFTNVTVIDVLIFLGRKYDLDIKMIGSIITIAKYKYLAPPPKPPVQKEISLKYDKITDQLSLDLKRDTLYSVAKEITRASGKNLIIPWDLENTTVSAFIQNQAFASALEMLAYANNLTVTTSDNNIYVFGKKEPEKGVVVQGDKSYKSFNSAKNNNSGIRVSNGLISLNSSNEPIQNLVISASESMGYNYYLFSDIKGNATLNIENSTYENFLNYLLNGTEYTYKRENGIYLIGDRNLEGLRTTKVLALKFRTVDKILDFIPSELKKGVELKAFPDLNSIIVSGSQPRTVELENFIIDIDKVVPVISIEVIILEVSNTSAVSKGLTAGISDKPVPTQGTIFPGIDMTISSSSINDLIDKIGGGIGSLVLGRVSSNFYMTLQLMETNGAVRIRSTPKLSTLNGHEATLSIGQTEYYLETQNSVVGTQNPQNITTQQYKSVNADLSLSINPIVSGDEQITLDIKVKQSTFTARISPTAPPGTVTRNFQSLIRIKNEEMIMLGGLEEKSMTETGRGLPGLSRIPFLKWIFGNRDRSRKKSKLVLLVKPTVLY